MSSPTITQRLCGETHRERKSIGAFDALICTAGPTYVGPWKNLNEEAFRVGVEGQNDGADQFGFDWSALYQSERIIYINYRSINPRPSNFANASEQMQQLKALLEQQP
jgi:hypothetical protein